MKPSTKAIRFLESLSIPEGPKAGQKVKLAPFQKQFVKGLWPMTSTSRFFRSVGAMLRLRYRLVSPWAQSWVNGTGNPGAKS